MSTFTPGPWRVVESPNSGETYIAAVTYTQTIARIQSPTNGEANARLIAAAPDLLLALLEARTALDDADTDLLRQVDDAIAKATGEQS